jgi:hypothetical protein
MESEELLMSFTLEVNAGRINITVRSKRVWLTTEASVTALLLH